MDTSGPAATDGDKHASTPRSFLEEIIEEDLKSGRVQEPIRTRFPPEPNGYLHIGHAKAICVNFGLALKYGGQCNLRFDDTNPIKEESEFVDSMIEDVRWLGFEWAGQPLFASDYFETLYGFAVQLIERGKAYVCDLPLAEVRAGRGSATEPGKNSPYRDRSVEENLDLFARMRAGEFPDGARTLRAKIDMAALNLQLRDPVMYRILRAHHHRTGDQWCIYPTYDWAHGQSDAIEGITHSLCTLEFVNHRDLYDWFLDNIDAPSRSRQYEFARLNLTYTMVKKTPLRELIENEQVTGWDDPRMPTLRGMRRRGYTPEALRAFCDTIGVTRANSRNDMALLENAVREDLNRRAERRMAVLRPLKVVIENLPEDHLEELDAVNNPEDEAAGTRKIPFTREVWIEQDDFREEAPRKFFRLAPGREVRLRYAYVIKCNEVIKDEAGQVVELRCTYDSETGGGKTPDGRKVKGILHWVSAAHAVAAEVRLYDHLFGVPDPGADDGDVAGDLNPDSLEVLTDCRLERGLADAVPGVPFQFERQGYFCADSVDSRPEALVFNRTVSLRDSWAKIQKKQNGR